MKDNRTSEHALLHGFLPDYTDEIEDTVTHESFHLKIRDRVGLGNITFPVDTPKDQIITALDNPNWRIRVAAIRAFAIHKEHIPANLLITALQDKHELVRIAAVQAISIVPENMQIEHLTEMLQDTKWTVRVAVVQVLGTVPEQAPVAELIKASLDEHEAVRAAAIQTFGRLGKRAPKKLLIHAFHDPELIVREAAVLALGELGERELLLSLIEKVGEEDELVHEALWFALNRQQQENSAKDITHTSALEEREVRAFQPQQSASTKNENKMTSFKPHLKHTLGQYYLARWIGRGGFGDVYEAYDSFLMRRVAIKVLHTRFTQENFHAFLNEARRLALLAHPHIIKVMEFNVQGKIPYLVMEFAAKGTLSQRHPMGQQLSLDVVSEYVQQIADALEYIHTFRSGMAHLDVKPENMLIAEDGRILLNDFGIASFLKKNAPRAEHFVGTTYYMAPECFEGKASFASDQYALAVVVYSWLTGRYPFEGTTAEIIWQHINTGPPLLGIIRPDISLAVEQVIRQGMAKKPEDRFESVREFALALGAARKEPTSRAIRVKRLASFFRHLY